MILSMDSIRGVLHTSVGNRLECAGVTELAEL